MEAQGKKTIAILLSSRPPQNVKLGDFTSYSCSDDKEMYKDGDPRAKLLFC